MVEFPLGGDLIVRVLPVHHDRVESAVSYSIQGGVKLVAGFGFDREVGQDLVHDSENVGVMAKQEAVESNVLRHTRLDPSM